MIAVESGSSAEIEEAVILEVQHRLDGMLARHADRRWRQPLINIGIVGRFVFEVFVQDAAQHFLKNPKAHKTAMCKVR